MFLFFPRRSSLIVNKIFGENVLKILFSTFGLEIHYFEKMSVCMCVCFFSGRGGGKLRSQRPYDTGASPGACSDPLDPSPIFPIPPSPLALRPRD